MAVSIVTYTGDGSTNQYIITFDYISRSHVSATVGGTAATFTFVNDTTIQFTTTPTANAVIQISRQTPIAALVDFTDGSTLFEADLDLAAKQGRLVAEEARDRADNALTTINNNIDDVNTVAANSATITSVATNITSVNNVATNMAEVLLADTNAATATTKAAEAVVSANTASAQATISTTKAGESYASAAAALASQNAAQQARTDTDASEALALAYKNSAQTAASTATTKASESSQSATTASSQAAVAIAKATEASTDAGIALAQAAVSTTKAAEASTSESNALSYKDTALAASAASETARAASVVAKDASQVAKTASEAARDAAAASQTAAATSETNAAASEGVATTQAGISTTKAGESAASATASLASQNAAASSETNSATSEGNAANSATASETSRVASVAAQVASETAKTASQTAKTASEAARDAAAASEIAGATSETNSAASEASASADAATATTKAGEASTSASNAALSASSAQASKDAALAALDSFDDRYLGQKTADPTVDNDGNALVSGALYFNSTDDIMKVYDGSLWVAAYASLSGAMFGANNLSDVADTASARANLGLVIGTNVQAFSAILANTTASYTTAEETKLAGIEAGATGDQTASEIRSLVEAATDSNVFTDADHSKLNAIEANAKDDQTITAGSGLTGGGTGDVTLNHADTSSVSNANNSGNTFIQDINFDGFGHVTSVGTGTVSVGNGTLTVQGTGALGGSGTFTANQSGNSTISISHDDTSSQGSVNNSGATVVQDVTLDGYGHVTGLGSHTLTLANLGYTGATNANYITNNNQLTNGAGYTTNVGDITNVTAGTNLTGGGSSGSVTVNLTASPNITSLNVGGSEVISSSRALKNIASVDATTVATLQGAGVGGADLSFTAAKNITAGQAIGLSSAGIQPALKFAKKDNHNISGPFGGWNQYGSGYVNIDGSSTRFIYGAFQNTSTTIGLRQVDVNATTGIISEVSGAASFGHTLYNYGTSCYFGSDGYGNHLFLASGGYDGSRYRFRIAGFTVSGNSISMSSSQEYWPSFDGSGPTRMPVVVTSHAQGKFILWISNPYTGALYYKNVSYSGGGLSLGSSNTVQGSNVMLTTGGYDSDTGNIYLSGIAKANTSGWNSHSSYNRAWAAKVTLSGDTPTVQSRVFGDFPHTSNNLDRFDTIQTSPSNCGHTGNYVGGRNSWQFGVDMFNVNKATGAIYHVGNSNDYPDIFGTKIHGEHALLGSKDGLGSIVATSSSLLVVPENNWAGMYTMTDSDIDTSANVKGVMLGNMYVGISSGYFATAYSYNHPSLASGFIGLAKTSASAGSSVTVDSIGSVNTSQSGKVLGQTYAVSTETAGELTPSGTNIVAYGTGTTSAIVSSLSS